MFINFCLCIDTELTLQDIPIVHKKLFDACSKWHNIGLVLNLDSGILSDISFGNENDLGKCLWEMLTHCVQTGDPLTWRDLCYSLRSPLVDCHDIAEDIEQWISTLPGM